MADINFGIQISDTKEKNNHSFFFGTGYSLSDTVYPKTSKLISETFFNKINICSSTSYTAEQLDAGNCAKCYGIKTPESRTPEQWEKVLRG